MKRVQFRLKEVEQEVVSTWKRLRGVVFLTGGLLGAIALLITFRGAPQGSIMHEYFPDPLVSIGWRNASVLGTLATTASSSEVMKPLRCLSSDTSVQLHARHSIGKKRSRILCDSIVTT